MSAPEDNKQRNREIAANEAERIHVPVVACGVDADANDAAAAIRAGAKEFIPLPPEADLQALETDSEATFRDKGMRWTDSRNAAPGVERFVQNIGSFLVLVGLAGLAVGGVGISAAIRSYLDSKVETIATLKTPGAEGGLIFRSHLYC